MVSTFHHDILGRSLTEGKNESLGGQWVSGENRTHRKSFSNSEALLRVLRIDPERLLPSVYIDADTECGSFSKHWTAPKKHDMPVIR